jgi:hypothetical protein
MFNNIAIFIGGELLAICPTHKLEEHILSTVCICLFNIFAATLHTGAHGGAVVEALRY